VAEIRWTQEAAHWLEEIHAYIAEDNPPAAARVTAGIYEKVQLLRQHPNVGYRYSSEGEDDVRVLLYGHYRIAYLIKPSGDIDILGIFHGAMDIKRYMP
jgi:plasmid stabilization system protein ParE